MFVKVKKQKRKNFWNRVENKKYFFFCKQKAYAFCPLSFKQEHKELHYIHTHIST